MWLIFANRKYAFPGVAGISLCASLVCTAQPVPAQSFVPPDTSQPARIEPRGVEPHGASDSPAQRAQISASTTAALENLRADISREPLTVTMTAGDFVRRAGGEDRLIRELARAEVVGGARWLDDQTCQVQVEISGAQVSRVLSQIAVTAKDRTIPSEEIARLTRDWSRRSFVATGSSTVFSHVVAARPRATNTVWFKISDTDRQRALVAAREDAVARTLASVRRVELGHATTIADALAIKSVLATVSDWLANRPVTRVNYRRDLQVELTFAATPDELLEIIRRSVEAYPELAPPTTEAGWAQVRRALIDRMEPPIGRGAIASDFTNPARPLPSPPPVLLVEPVPHEVVRLPLGAPRWTNDAITATGAADGTNSKLKAAREAETTARHKLVDQINGLPLTATLTIGQASKQDPRLHDAVLRAVDRARVDKTDYYHGRDVTVDLHLDLREVWEQMRSLP